MKRIFTTALSAIALTSIASPSFALSNRFEQEFHDGIGNKLSGRHAEEFQDGIGNKGSTKTREAYLLSDQ